jgi:hypothetical protein
MFKQTSSNSSAQGPSAEYGDRPPVATTDPIVVAVAEGQVRLLAKLAKMVAADLRAGGKQHRPRSSS